MVAYRYVLPGGDAKQPVGVSFPICNRGQLPGRGEMRHEELASAV